MTAFRRGVVDLAHLEQRAHDRDVGRQPGWPAREYRAAFVVLDPAESVLKVMDDVSR